MRKAFKMIRTLIIDDEIRARETIQAMLEIYCKDVQVVGQAKNVRTGIEAIKEHKPDLVLLDIKMPDGSGFDLLARYGKINFKVIFITAFEEYAIQAFKFSAIDYLLKPIEPEELIKAIDKVNEHLLQISHPNTMDVQFEAFLSNLKNRNGEDKKLVLKTTENIYVIPIHEVISLSSDRNYTRFNFLERPPIIVSKTLKEFENILLEYGFMRVHRSHVINLKYIERFEKADGGYAVMHGGLKIEVSHRKKEDLLAFFDQL